MSTEDWLEIGFVVCAVVVCLALVFGRKVRREVPASRAGACEHSPGPECDACYIGRLLAASPVIVELCGRVAALEAKIEADEDYAREQAERRP